MIDSHDQLAGLLADACYSVAGAAEIQSGDFTISCEYNGGVPFLSVSERGYSGKYLGDISTQQAVEILNGDLDPRELSQ